MYDDFVSPIHSSNPPDSLEDLTDIEDALVSINQRTQRIDWYKKLKAKRAAEIDEHIKREEANVKTIRNAICECMKSNGSKVLKFPAIGKVSTRVKKGKWVVDDQDSLLEHLKTLELYDKVATQEVKVNKTSLNKILNELEKNNNTSDAVSKEADSTDITISFDDDAEIADMFIVPEAKISQKSPEPSSAAPDSASVTADEFDNLEV